MSAGAPGAPAPRDPRPSAVPMGALLAAGAAATAVSTPPARVRRAGADAPEGPDRPGSGRPAPGRPAPGSTAPGPTASGPTAPGPAGVREGVGGQAAPESEAA
ncbi:hypothetical protein AB0F11_14395 [Streptomyces sp. NPDC032472]|uniref:hypothetical protein n=1 Tax=Streptomyces sp. NPDC032472 TaxID=3155018 RepID=UPI0033EBB91D